MSWSGKTAVNGLIILLCGICLPITGASAEDKTTSSDDETASSDDRPISAGATAGIVLSDNAGLEESNKEGDLRLVFTPYISLHRKRAKTNLDLTGTLELSNRANLDLTEQLERFIPGRGSNSLRLRLEANANAELREESVYMDARVTASQHTRDPFSASGFEALSRTGNQTTTFTYALSPYAINHFANFADLLTRYTFTGLTHTNSQINDSYSQAFSTALNSGSDFSRTPWGLIGNYSKTNNAGGSDNELISADARLGYKFNRKWQISASVGREWNDFRSTDSEVDGSRWDFHIIWTPRLRTSLDIGYGDRFFGSTPSLNFNHRSRRSAINVSYSRVLTDTHTLLSSQDIFQENDAFDRPIDPINGDPQEVSPILTRLEDSVFVNDNINATYSILGRRTTLTLSGSYSKQTSQDTQREDKFLRYGISLSREISRLMSGDISLNLHREEDAETNANSTTKHFKVGVSRKLNHRSSLRLSYALEDRNSDKVDDSFVENRLNFSIRIDL